MLLDEDVPEDSEIVEKMNNHAIDLTALLSDEESKQAALGFALIAISSAFKK